MRAPLERRIRVHWKDQCRGVVVRFYGAFAYVDAFPLESQFVFGVTPEERGQIETTPIHLCRLGYLRRADIWAFAFFKYSDEKYEASFLPSSASVGSPEEAFDCAAHVLPPGLNWKASTSLSAPCLLPAWRLGGEKSPLQAGRGWCIRRASFGPKPFS